ncbi:MAG: hypothetical protein JWM76_3421 [Pseudonocardiales bacterium]|nr:hypothetical protein [Pseudonocardiales bacterium]
MEAPAPALDAASDKATAAPARLVQAGSPSTGYRHEATFYRGEEGFLGDCVPFLQEGLRIGQPTLVAVSAPKIARLKEMLPGDSDQLHFVDMAELGRNPARMIAAWHRFVADHRPLSLRGIGEPIWPGRRPAQIAECQLHEALLNVAIEPDVPLTLRCPYDIDALPASVIDAARRSHRTVVEDSEPRSSETYVDDGHLELFAQLLAVAPLSAAELRFDHGSESGVRDFVSGQGQAAGLDRDRIDDLALAVYELATNSVRHGGGFGTVRAWRSAEGLLCEVADAGFISDPLIGRIPPSPTAPGGRGVWIANQLCDLVQVRSTARGSSIRITTFLD